MPNLPSTVNNVTIETVDILYTTIFISFATSLRFMYIAVKSVFKILFERENPLCDP